jgi:glycosyltransferase involved in cell wall biosynthesis
VEAGKRLRVVLEGIMNTVSLIAVYNNPELLDQLVASAELQKDVDLEYVFIDNTNRQFSSAAKALNYGVSKANGEILVFLHQDIEFLNDNAVLDIYQFGKLHPNTVFGAAGVKAKISDTADFFSSIYAGENKVQYECCTAPTECYTLDECLIACHRSCMQKISFDEKICDGWHLYGADLCLQAGLIPELNVMVIPMDYVWHKSNGNADKSYMETQNKLAEKYQGKYKIINTTNGFQYTNPLRRFFLNIYRGLRYNI